MKLKFDPINYEQNFIPMLYINIGFIIALNYDPKFQLELINRVSPLYLKKFNNSNTYHTILDENPKWTAKTHLMLMLYANILETSETTEYLP